MIPSTPAVTELLRAWSEGGQTEVFVSRLPGVGSDKWQMSRNGGRTPLWARNGRELFYRELDESIVGVRVDSSAG